MSLAAPVRQGLQALGALAARPERSLGVAELARLCGLPAAALSKTLQRLARRGLLESRRGPGGGYRLAQNPARVTLAAVAAALGAEERRRGGCLLAERSCDERSPCLLHAAAVAADARMRRELDGLTLADLAASKRGRP